MKCQECGKTMNEYLVRDEPEPGTGESGVMEGKMWECPDPCCDGERIWE